MASNNEAHTKLITELQGQVMHVPNMLEVLSNWPSCGRSKYYRRLKGRLDDIVERVYSDEKKRRRAAKNDFALFTSIWYPEADWERLYACGVFSFWIFVCDDTMDANDEALALDFEASNRYRQQVLEYTRYWLGLDPEDSQVGVFGKLFSWLLPEKGWLRRQFGLGYKTEPPSPDEPCAVFKEFGQLVQRTRSKEFRELFQRELKFYFDLCAVEQRERLTGETATDFKSYLNIRFGTSAVRVYCLITEVALGTQLPVWLHDTPEMQALWKEANINIIIGNDILSAKKELAAGCVHNAIPIMYHQGKSLDAVIPELMLELQACRDRFDEAALVVEKLAAKSGVKVHGDVVQYIDGLRTIAAGTIEFCKIAERYGLEKYFNNDGTMDVVL